MIERLKLANAPEPKGPYSPAVRVGDLLFVSGQGPIDPVTNEFVLGTIEEQTCLTIENIRSILINCDCNLENVVKCSVFIVDPGDFAAMNRIYSEFFGANKPARTTIAAALVEPGMKVEIDCIAWAPTK
jgi:2-iminobutanoate/2-iminopropanoate deaminase